MTKQYKFEHKDMKFSKDGQLDELIALDRYAIPTYDGYEVGDVVVAIVDKTMGTKKVAEITKVNNDETYEVKDRFGETHTVEKELMQKPLETEPHQLWERWAKGAASVEKTPQLKNKWENKYRKLFDGYRYSLGGRIQLMLGQEFVTGKKAKLTAFNCFVARSPETLDDPTEQFIDVLDVAYKEANIMKRGGGVGINISTINTIKGTGRKSIDFIFYLDKEHKDYEELKDRIALGKFNGVTVVTSLEEYEKLTKDAEKINVTDSMDNGIFDELKQMVRLSYEGNKVGLNFNKMRHRDALVKSVNGRSSGSVSWMELFVLVANIAQLETIDNVEFAEIFSHIVHLIIQGGSRRGALMLINTTENDNIYKFMERKKTAGYLSGANISVAISDSFMDKVIVAKEKQDKQLLTSEEKYAYDLWTVLYSSAWGSAEPGIVWMERMNKESNSYYYVQLIATNPCGEQPLPPWGVCNLGHFVLPRFYNALSNDVNWSELAESVETAVRLQDNIVDYTPYFLDENEEVQKNERRVGIGSMGLGTLMIQLGLRYGSEKGNEFIDKLYKFIAVEAYKTSIDLAVEKGKFPKCEPEKMAQSGFMKRLLPELPKEYQDKFFKHGIRNVTLLTQAPTGSTGTYIDNIPLFRERFAGTTTGIEPYFSWEYWRAGRLGITKQTVDLAQKYINKHGLKDISELPDYFVTAMNLSPLDHVRVQAAVQKWTDSSISKTANCPSDYTLEQTEELYLESYKLGLKGMTIYRDGSRQAQVLATKEEDAKLESHIEAEKLKELKEHEKEVKVEMKQQFDPSMLIQKRPKRLYGFTDKVGFSYGDKFGRAYVTINLNDGIPWEVFISTKEKEVSGLAKALGLMTTKLLRLGGTSDNLQQAIDTLTYDQTMGTLPSAVANILKQIQKEKMEIDIKKGEKKFELAECPHCGEKAYDRGNCICAACGVSKCN